MATSFVSGWLTRVSLLAVLLSLASASVARGEVAIYADGRTAFVTAPVQDSKGGWTAVFDGRRQRLDGGRVVALANDAGEETSLMPALVDGATSAQQESALKAMLDTKDEMWFAHVESLRAPPTRAVLEALGELAGSPKKQVRVRAVTAMARMYTRESALEAARRVLAEKDSKARREGAGALFAVREILRRADAKELIDQGLEDKDALVRVEFALVAPHDSTTAGAVLTKDGLRHAVHHVREAAALELGRRGDGAGEALLIEMLGRAKLPGMDGDPQAGTRFLIREQVEVCEILGRLASTAGDVALARAKAASPHEAVRTAAEKALAR